MKLSKQKIKLNFCSKPLQRNDEMRKSYSFYSSQTDKEELVTPDSWQQKKYQDFKVGRTLAKFLFQVTYGIPIWERCVLKAKGCRQAETRLRFKCSIQKSIKFADFA